MFCCSSSRSQPILNARYTIGSTRYYKSDVVLNVSSRHVQSDLALTTLRGNSWVWTAFVNRVEKLGRCRPQDLHWRSPTARRPAAGIQTAYSAVQLLDRLRFGSGGTCTMVHEQ